MIKINTLYSLENISDCYEVDSSGNIVNKISGKTKKYTKGKRGYYYVTLSLKNSNKQKKVYVHKIISLAFIRNEKYEVINHIDGDKLNNSIDNLEFCSQKQNIIHSWGLKLTTRTEKIFIIGWLDGTITSGTIIKLVEETGIPKSTLYTIYYSKRGSTKHNIKEIKLI